MEPGRSMATLPPCAVTGPSDPAATTRTAATATMRLSMTDLLDLVGWRRRGPAPQEARHPASGRNNGRAGHRAAAPPPPASGGRGPAPQEPGGRRTEEHNAGTHAPDSHP